ncbi:Ubiquitin fusion degradation protein Ufd1-like - like 3 [Theobroma cacao]|nr:Ubiquitin fusion degradation protein Ufd1-like - like 3 [Theobroma cacao]
MERSDLEAVAAAAAAAMELDSSFQHTHRCYASRVELGNRILMPLSAFDSLVDKGVESPWLFELCNPVTGKTSHCGVLEFTSDEGFVLLPAPMMESMELEEGELVTLKSASLDKGTFLKLQPHTKNFMQLSDPKAVLEKAFRDFCCLTTGDTIMIMHNDIKFYIDIVEAKPSLAVNIIDTDCEVDFALPLDYEPPQKKQKKAKLLQKQEQPIEAETVKFKAFNGIARRLDGEPVTEQVAVDDDHDWMMNAERKPCGSKKVVLGSNVIQSQEDSTGEPSRKGWQEVTNMKKEEEKFQPFTGRSYTLAHGSQNTPKMTRNSHLVPDPYQSLITSTC